MGSERIPTIDNPPNGPGSGLPLRGSNQRPARRTILAAHYVWTGYGHWLPNDPRGSGSESTRKDELSDLGPIHHGRKKPQPKRDELRAFYRNARHHLAHAPFWFHDR